MDNLPYLLNGTVRFWTALTWILAMSVSKASALTQNQTLVDNVLLDFSIIYCKPVSEYAFTHPRLRSCYHIWLKETSYD